MCNLHLFNYATNYNKINICSNFFYYSQILSFVARESSELLSQKSKCNQLYLLLSYGNVKVQKNKDT